jgi:GTP-binding protein Era
MSASDEELLEQAEAAAVIDQLRQWHDFSEIVPISATTADGVDRLERLLLQKMREGEPLYPEDFLTDQRQRTLAAETVREKVLQHTRAELPFSTAVVIDQDEESCSAPGATRGTAPSNVC